MHGLVQRRKCLCVPGCPYSCVADRRTPGGGQVCPDAHPYPAQSQLCPSCPITHQMCALRSPTRPMVPPQWSGPWCRPLSCNEPLAPCRQAEGDEQPTWLASLDEKLSTIDKGETALPRVEAMAHALWEAIEVPRHCDGVPASWTMPGVLLV